MRILPPGREGSPSGAAFSRPRAPGKGAAAVMRLALLLGLVLCLPGRALADASPRAGLVVQAGDGQILTRCVALEADEVSGYDLLLSSGLEVVLDTSSGLGVTVCQIEDKGCAYPQEPCFCQCSGGGRCAYWNYFYRDPQAADWSYSAMGAMMHPVSHGAVEAWVWGDGQTPPSAALTFDSICGVDAATPVMSPQSTSAPASTAVAAATELPLLTPTGAAQPTVADRLPTVGSLPTATGRPPAEVPAASGIASLAGYWPFGLMILALALAGFLISRRRG